MAVKDVTKLVERLEAFEDRLGVRIESLSAHLNADDDESVYLVVRGELHPKSGTELEQSIELVVAAYDSASRVVATGSEFFDASSFFGFEIFDVTVEIPVKNLARVRIHPKRSE